MTEKAVNQVVYGSGRPKDGYLLADGTRLQRLN